MDGEFGEIPITRKTGREQFHLRGEPTGNSLSDFWRWSASDLPGNTARGILAEYIVALDLGVANGTWSGWDSYDLKTEDGIKVEVKSCAYIQAWNQKNLSAIKFGIAPTRAWDPHTNWYAEKVKRWADVYVFCVLACKDPAKLDPLDLQQWDFYILPTSVLDQRVGLQKSIVLSSLKWLGPSKVSFGEIDTTARSLLERNA